MLQFIRRMIAALLRTFRTGNPPQDPYAGVREPRGRNPGGRSSAAAVAIPTSHDGVHAVASAPGSTHADRSEG
jgi:hypothetical protein